MGVVTLLNWSVTPWQMNGKGGWKTQPIIVVEGRIPFYADHPQAYIDKLLELHGDPALLRMQTLYESVGRFKDALEYFWNVKEQGEKSPNRNGDRPGEKRRRARAK